MNTYILENEALRVQFNAGGALTGLVTKKTGWNIVNNHDNGLSFRLLVPHTSRRNNPVYGEKQPPPSVECSTDASWIKFTWDSVVSEFAGELNIGIHLTVSLSESQALWNMTVSNHSDFIVENVYSPYFCHVAAPPGSAWLKAFLFKYARAEEWSMWPEYENLRGYFGIDYPTQISTWSPSVGAPMAPYILLRGEEEGLYVGTASDSGELVVWTTELRPGWEESIDSRVPAEDSIAGKQVETRFAPVHIPYIAPGDTRTLTPIAIEPFQGDWNRGVDLYKNWLSTWMKRPEEMPEWIEEPHAWQQLHINSPEDELRMPFTDLPKIARECKDRGVKAIQLVGWTKGGQDQGNPSHDFDPRLGTFEELKTAIAETQRLGIKVILFAKFVWADRATEEFRENLKRLAIKDPYGDYYQYSGYKYQTVTQLADINTKRLIPMCFLAEDYLDVCNAEFQKILDLGADGLLFDECLHHSPALVCFDTSHGHRYGAMVYAHDRKIIENFHQIAQKGDRDFLFAGEACYDFQFETYHLSYHRSEDTRHIPLSRYVFPHTQLMTAVTGFNDRNMVNQCLLYRYIISYEPYNFKGRLDDFPLTLEYGRKMDALRTELREYFWDGEFRHTEGVIVTSNGQPHHPYAVYNSLQSGKKGVVIANYHQEERLTVQVSYTGSQSKYSYRYVESSDWDTTDSAIVIPARCAVVVLEEKM